MSFNPNQIELIQKERKDLRFLPTNTDIFVMEFLRLYDVNVQPTDIASWNGWDTLATLDAVLDASRGNVRSIGSSVFYASKSMQVSQASKQAAEDWTTWKKWALDHKEFNDFKKNRIKEIEKYNNLILEKINNPDIKTELDAIVIKGEASARVLSFYKNLKYLIHGCSGYFYIMPILDSNFTNGNNFIYFLFAYPLISLFLVESLIPNILISWFCSRSSKKNI